MKETPAVEEEPPTLEEAQSLAELAGPNEGKGAVLRLFDKVFDTDD